MSWGNEQPTYEDYVGLWLNRDIATMKKALSTMFGAGMAFGGKMTPEVSYAISDTEEQGEHLIAELQAKEAAKIPMTKMPKELRELVAQGKVKREDFTVV